MLCAYCKEPMNEGAGVCKACGRKQPMSRVARDKWWRWLTLAVLIVPVLGALIYWAYYSIDPTFWK